MAYADYNFKTKKAFREAVLAGKRVYLFQPGPFPLGRDRTQHVEGPHYPEAHRWYAQARVDEDGIIIKGSVK